MHFSAPVKSAFLVAPRHGGCRRVARPRTERHLGQHVYPRLPQAMWVFGRGVRRRPTKSMTVKGKEAMRPCPTCARIGASHCAHLGGGSTTRLPQRQSCRTHRAVVWPHRRAGSTNIIPNEVREGTFRAMDETWRRGHALLTNLVQDMAAAHGCTVVGHPRLPARQQQPRADRGLPAMRPEYVGEERVPTLAFA